MKIKPKINKWDPIKVKSFFHSKWNHKQNEKTTNGMGENICEWSNWQGVNLQNIQTKKKNNNNKKRNLIKKWAEDLDRHFSKDIQMAKKHMKRCSTLIAIYLKNAHQNCNEVSAHTSQNGHHQSVSKQ